MATFVLFRARGLQKQSSLRSLCPFFPPPSLNFCTSDAFSWREPCVSLCSQMMPEIRMTLFGANPNRKFMDWAAATRLQKRKTSSIYFLFLWQKMKFLCLWKQSSAAIPTEKRLCDVVWCVAVMFPCVKGRDGRLQMCIEGVAQMWRSLECSRFTHCFVRGDVIGGMWHISCSDWISVTNAASVSHFYPVSLTPNPHDKLHGALCG